MQRAESEARQMLLNELAALPMDKRLEHLAWDDLHDLVYFPAALFETTATVLQNLHPATLERVLEKVSARKQGSWHKWAEQCNTLLKGS
jgi:hypothetical protein